jgi:type I restriction enzyme S subunit
MFDFDFSDVAYIDDSMHHDMRRTWVKNNDVLLNITGASIGRVNFFTRKDDTANVNQHVCIIRPVTQLIEPSYLTYHLGMPSYQDKIVSQNAGATRQAFTFKQIREFRLMLPPLSLQYRFSEAWEKTRRLRQRQWFAHEKEFQLFNSLQQRAFRGEL